MQGKMVEAVEQGNYQLSHFGPDANLFAELEDLFRAYGATGERETPQISPRRGRSGAVRPGAWNLHALGGPSRDDGRPVL